MIIKKFTGKSEEEAVTAAKKELGDGIVIMNVRLVKPKGLFGAFRAKQTEVTVALEEDRELPRKDRGRDRVRTISDSAQPVGSAVQSRAEEAEKIDISAGQSSIEKKLDSLQTFLEKQLIQKEAEARENPSGRADADHIEEKAAEKAPGQESDKPEAADNEQDKFVRLLYNTMIDNEVDEKYVNQILEEVDRSRKPNMPFDYILANVYQKIILKFGRSDGIEPAEKGPKVVFFIGPTGVGKTTTIAKIASGYALEEKKKTALFTTDTYRIAATEQLSTYAQIMGVPFQIIYSPEEFQGTLERFKDYEYIFVDTAGHSHQNAEQMESMKEFLKVAGEQAQVQTFLVLSATTKYRDLLKIADTYRQISEYQLIFTKLDETSAMGNLLNLKLHTDTPIAYITCGQNVPTDIEKFNPQKTVKQLLGGKS